MSGGTIVAIKQETTVVDNLVTGFVDSTTFVNSPAVQQQQQQQQQTAATATTTTTRQQGSSQTTTTVQRTNDDCEPVTLPSKSDAMNRPERILLDLILQEFI